jgi:hypothetical protein
MTNKLAALIQGAPYSIASRSQKASICADPVQLRQLQKDLPAHLVRVRGGDTLLSLRIRKRRAEGAPAQDRLARDRVRDDDGEEREYGRATLFAGRRTLGRGHHAALPYTAATTGKTCSISLTATPFDPALNVVHVHLAPASVVSPRAPSIGSCRRKCEWCRVSGVLH